MYISNNKISTSFQRKVVVSNWVTFTNFVLCKTETQVIAKKGR